MRSDPVSRRRGLVSSTLPLLLLVAFLSGRVQGAPFIRGDADQSGGLSLTDSIRILSFLFLGGPSGTCLDALDTDDTGIVNLTDGIVGLQFLFLGGPPPAAPFPGCGEDPTTGDRLDCVAHAACPDVVDTGAPEIEIVAPSNLAVLGTRDLEVRGVVSDSTDAIADLEVSVNSIPVDPDPATGAFVVTIRLREGENRVTAVAVDPGGNTTTVTITAVLDTSPPTIVVDSPASDISTPDPRITLTGYLNDVGSSQVGGEVGAVFVRSTTIGGQVIVPSQRAELNGRAFVLLDFPLRRGVNRIEVTGVDGVGNEARPVLREVVSAEVAGQRIVRVSGDGQAAPILSILAQPLVVALVDADGRAMPDRTVRFAVVRNSGLLSATAGPGPRARELFVRTDASGIASARLTLGDRVGAGLNRVSATAAGFAGEALFCATAVPGIPTQILVTRGARQTGVPGRALPEPLVVQAIDEVGNPIPGLPITFRVLAGGGRLSRGGKSGGVAGLGTELVVSTSDEGLASAVWTLGLQEGLNAHVAVASFQGLAGLAGSFSAAGILPGRTSDTVLVGTVLDNSDEPLAGVTAFILGTDLSAQTDAEGRFRIPQAPVGAIQLYIDGRTTTRPGTWPQLEFSLTTIAGRENSTGEPIRLPEVDVDNEFAVGGESSVVVTMNGVPGMSITVAPRSVTFPDGSRTGRLSLSQVKLDKVPMPPPNGSIFMPPAWTIQPAGVIFDPPARVTIPNDGLPPGRIIDIFQFDHLLGQFVNVGTGTVVPDGSVIVSDPGFGIVRAGWGGCGQPPPPPTCAASCGPCQKCENGACVTDPAKVGQACDDGMSCTSGDTCSPAGVCMGMMIGPACGANGAAMVVFNVNRSTTAGTSTAYPTSETLTGGSACVDKATGVWRYRVGTVTTNTNVEINETPPAATPNPVPGGNVTMANYCTIIGVLAAYKANGFKGAWHSTAASVAHEDFHNNTHWKAEAFDVVWAMGEGELEMVSTSCAGSADAAAALTSMQGSVNTKFADIRMRMRAQWNMNWMPDDGPNARPYCAGQAVLDGIIANIRTFAMGQGWPACP